MEVEGGGRGELVETGEVTKPWITRNMSPSLLIPEGYSSFVIIFLESTRKNHSFSTLYTLKIMIFFNEG